MPTAVRPLTPEQRRRLAAAAVASLLLFVALAIAARGQSLAGVDGGAHAWLQLLRHATYPLLGPPTKLLGSLCSGWVLAVVGIAGCLAVAGRDRQLAILAMVALAVAPVVQGLTKVVVAHRRPHLTAYSFPSGHVFGATIAYGLALYLLWAVDAPRPWRRAATVVGALIVVGGAWSRLYVNAHWLSDVVGGLVGGLGYLLCAVLLVDRRLRPPTIAT